jgi:hypothetical protein
MVPPPFKDRH